MAANLNRVYAIVGRQFKDPTFVTEALQAAGSEIRYAGTRAIPDGNKRLALVGDTVLKLAILDSWYEEGGSRGNVSISNQRVVSNSNLSIIGRQNGLAAYINLSPGHQGIVSEKTMATTVEALLGAAWHDSGKDLNAVTSVMRALGLEYTSGSPIPISNEHSNLSLAVTRTDLNLSLAVTTTDSNLSLAVTTTEEPAVRKDEKI